MTEIEQAVILGKELISACMDDIKGDRITQRVLDSPGVLEAASLLAASAGILFDDTNTITFLNIIRIGAYAMHSIEAADRLLTEDR